MLLPRWPERPDGLPVSADETPPRHVHLIPSLSLGGAERIALELCQRLARSGASVDLVVIRESDAAHPAEEEPGLRIHRLGTLPWSERLARTAALVRATGLPAYAHLTSLPEMETLWSLGARTVPVVHNTRDGWRQDPAAWPAEHVPFAVACGDRVAADLRAARPDLPVRVFRHVVVAHPRPLDRAAARAALGAGPSTALVGMVGRIAVQKNYPRAVEVLAALRARGTDARLAVVGDAKGPEGAACRAALLARAEALGVAEHLVLSGPVAEAARLLPAFDAFLNTSFHEGVSIATMEAVAAGVPVVSLDAGGQDEAIGPSDALLPQEASAEDLADAVQAALARPRTGAPDTAWLAEASAHLWPWTLALGPGSAPARGGIWLATANLDVGGAQRSAGILAGALAEGGTPAGIAVCGPVGVPEMARPALEGGAEVVRLRGPGEPGFGLRRRAGRLLALLAAKRPEAVCCWNLDPPTKAVLAQALADGPVRLADASPGPLLFRELEEASATLRALSTTPEGYLRLLGAFAAKHADGLPPAGMGPARQAVIPNGVRAMAALPEGEGPAPPPGADPALAVVSVGRLVGDKFPGLWPALAQALDARVPGATLTLVGGVHDGQAAAEAERLWAEAGPLPANLVLAGPDARAPAFLHRFAAFAMASLNQGCPNASLEAMIAGIPVVANADGGTGEQVVEGETGFLVPTADVAAMAEAMADRLALLLRDPARARAMGQAGQARAREMFSPAKMALRYRTLLLSA